jgi:hypothetical protein
MAVPTSPWLLRLFPTVTAAPLLHFVVQNNSQQISAAVSCCLSERFDSLAMT